MDQRLLGVGIDARALNVFHMRGTGRYILELLRHTRAEDRIRWTVYGHDPSVPMHVPPEVAQSVEFFEFRGHRFHLWEQIGLPLTLRRSELQVMHCADNTASIWQPLPTVVTIHDTVPWAQECASALERHYLHTVQAAAFRNCAAIVTISESSRKDILTRWPVLEPRLRVIPHGIGDEFFNGPATALPTSLSQQLRGAPYLLYLGGAQPRKRFDWAVEVLARLGRQDMHMIAVGFAAGTANLQRIPEDLRTRIHIAPFVTENELVALYKGAKAALYPTLYEGFGFPAVEAQAAGTPVLFSPVSSLAELTGPLVWPVQPHDMDEWATTLETVLNLSVAARAEQSAKALVWARRFSWRTSALAHIALYRELAEAGR